MRCEICDKEDSLISFDKKAGRFCPCNTCQVVIDECLATYGDDSEFEPLEVL